MFIGPLVVLAVIFAVPGGMWLPLERVTIGFSEVVAYVLENENGWATLMEEDKTIMRAPATAITERVVCDQGEYQSLLTIWAGGSEPTPQSCSLSSSA